jgi:hypothetical protein
LGLAKYGDSLLTSGHAQAVCFFPTNSTAAAVDFADPDHDRTRSKSVGLKHSGNTRAYAYDVIRERMRFDVDVEEYVRGVI